MQNIYNKLLFLSFAALLLSVKLYAKIIEVPKDYSTIQMGINAASDGDTVLVSDGVYYENLLIIDKEIVLASMFIIDSDSSHIKNTVINGKYPTVPNRASTLSIIADKRMYLSPVIIGFTITGGKGTLVEEFIETADGTQTIEKYVGGGLFIKRMNPVFSYNRIVDNKTEEIETSNKRKKTSKGENAGGGSYSFFSRPNFGGDIYGKNEVNPGGNVFLNNYATIGKTFYAELKDSTQIIKAENCIFDIYNYENGTITEYWAVSNTGENSFSFIGGAGEEASVAADVFVSPNGDNKASGLTSETAFRTIEYALSKVYSDSLHPVVIKLLPGIYSPQTNKEVFPLQAVNHTQIYGSGISQTIIDAQGSEILPQRVFVINRINDFQIHGVTITGGYNHIWNTAGGGGGIYCKESTGIALKNVRVSNNKAGLEGGGLFITKQSVVKLENVEIIGNEANKYGGGIFAGFGSVLDLNNVTIANNIAQFSMGGGGGGIYANYFTNIRAKNSKIIGNTALNKGGGIFLTDSKFDALNTEISHNIADKGAGIYSKNATIDVVKSVLVNNAASEEGGGMFLLRTENVYVNSSKIIDNTAKRGGGFFTYNASLVLDKNTLSNNQAAKGGGGLHLDFASDVQVSNSILWNNTQYEIESTPKFFPNKIVVAYCSIKDSIDGLKIDALDSLNWLNGNQNTDPQFDEQYSPAPTSALVDGGTAFYMYKNEVLINIPNEMYAGKAPDIGAIEYENNATATTISQQANSGKLILNPPYPNPFYDKVIFNIEINEPAFVNLMIYDAAGKRVKSFRRNNIQSGSYNFVWNTNTISNGIYFYKLQSDTFVKTGKITQLTNR